MSTLTLFYSIICAVLAVPVMMFTLECLIGSLRFRKKASRRPNDRPRLTVLMPAHNEEEVIEATLTSLQAQVAENDGVLVVADNCSDSTADIVRRFNFDVTERFHDTDQVKGSCPYDHESF